jgi:eukaryotic-like serine/threonine-protein kinase
VSTAQPGTVMVDRYRLSQPAATDLASADAWEAHDLILDRPVRVTFVDGPHATATLDAARRAALVADPRLGRVLDVGTTDLGFGARPYIISEPYRGSSLTEVVSHGLVDAQQARAIVGEAAAALDAAAQRGVHHQALRPDAVRVDGHRVVVTGLGIDAALAGMDAGGDDAAAADDARNLVALVYYALTARWAGDSLDESWVSADAVRPLPAQLDERGVIPVSTLVPHVDEGIDLLVNRTFATDAPDAPGTPGEVVTALAPWGEVSVVDALPQFVQPTSEPPVRSSVLGAGAGAPGRPGTPPPAPPVRRPTTGRIARAGVVGAAAGATQAFQPAGSPPAPADPQATAAMAPQQPWQPTTPQQNVPQTVGAAYRSAAAGIAYAAAPPPEGGTVHAPVPPPPPGAGGPAEPQTPSGGFASTPAPRRRGVNPTPIVMALVVVLVIAGALWAVSRALDPFEPPIAAGQSPTEDTAGTGSDESAEPETSEPEPEETTAARPRIKSGDQLDPEGDGQHPEAVDLAYDADPSTFWYTQWFSTPEFGGLKSGIGYVIELEQAAPVSTIELNTNSSGGRVEVRATSASEPTDGDVLAEGSFDRTTTLELSEETVADSFVLWITEMPKTGEQFYLELNEIVIS